MRNNIASREWANGKLVKYESLRVSNDQVESSRLKNGQVASRYVRIYNKCQFFNVKYHEIIGIVNCESGRLAQKWSSVCQICEYAVAGTRPFPNCFF